MDNGNPVSSQSPLHSLPHGSSVPTTRKKRSGQLVAVTCGHHVPALYPPLMILLAIADGAVLFVGRPLHFPVLPVTGGPADWQRHTPPARLRRDAHALPCVGPAVPHASARAATRRGRAPPAGPPSRAAARPSRCARSACGGGSQRRVVDGLRGPCGSGARESFPSVVPHAAPHVPHRCVTRQGISEGVEGC